MLNLLCNFIVRRLVSVLEVGGGVTFCVSEDISSHVMERKFQNNTEGFSIEINSIGKLFFFI